MNQLRKVLNEKNIIFVILVGMVILFSLPTFRSGIYYGHDLIFHLGRIQEIGNELSKGQFPVRYEYDASYGYGYISSIMYPNIFMYFPALLYVAGEPLFRAYNIYVLGVNVLTVVLSYYSFRRIFKSNWWGLLATGIYCFSAYRFSNVYTRAAVGEFTAMAFIPLLLLGFYQLYFEEVAALPKSIIRRISPIVIAVTGIIESHILTTELLAVSILIFVVLNIKQTFAVIKELLLSVIFILAINGFFLVPFLQTYLGQPLKINIPFGENGIDGEGLYISQFFKPFSEGRGWDLSWSPDHEEFIALGLAMVICVALTIVAIFLRRKLVINDSDKVVFRRMMTIFGIGILAAYVSTIYFPWIKFAGDSMVDKLMSSVQFPWRYLLIQTICFMVTGVYSLRLIAVKLEGSRPVGSKIVFIGLAVFGLIAFLQSAVYYKYLVGNESVSYASIQDWPGEADDLYLPAGTNKRIIKDNLDVVIEDGKATLPIFGYENVVLLDADKVIDWTLGDNNRVVIDEKDYSESIEKKYMVPACWRLAEVISVIGVLGFAFGVIKKEH